MASDESRMRAEAVFRTPEPATKNNKISAEQAAAAQAADTNRARLKSLRLAKEAAARATSRLEKR